MSKFYIQYAADCHHAMLQTITLVENNVNSIHNQQPNRQELLPAKDTVSYLMM